MSEIEFVDGLIVKPPHKSAPDFVKCKISIKRKDLGNWLRSKSDEWINIDVKVSKNGKWYVAVNDWKPTEQQMAEAKHAAQGTQQPVQQQDDLYDDDIPF